MQPLPPARASEPRTRTTRRRATQRFFWYGLVAAAFAAVVWWRGRPARELRAMPPAARQALFERTLETLRTTCLASAGAALDDICIDAARLARSFPECDRECRALAGRFAPLAVH